MSSGALVEAGLVDNPRAILSSGVVPRATLGSLRVLRTNELRLNCEMSLF